MPTPIYNTSNGSLTDYGLSIGASDVNHTGNTGGTNSSGISGNSGGSSGGGSSSVVSAPVVSSGGSSGGGSSATPIHTAINPEDGTPLPIGTTVTVNGVRYYGTAPSTPASIALVTATPPTNAANITPTPPPTLPDTTPTAGNIDNATGSIAGLQSWIETQMQIATDQQTANAATVGNSQNGQQEQSWLARLISSPSPTEVSNQTWQQTGIDPTQYYADQQAGIAEIGSLTADYNRIKAARDQQIAATQDRMGSMNFINNQTAQIERNAAPQLNELSANINSKAAVLQALQGNFNSARDFVNLAVQNATADLKYEFDMYTTFHTLNEDAIAKLDKPYQDALEMKIKLAEMAYTQAVADKTAIGNLMISNPQAGITINDSLDSAYSKIGIHPATSSQIIGSAESGYTNVITDSSGKVISSTPVKGTGGGSGTGNNDITTYAQSYLDGQVEITGVPQDIRADVLAKANEIAKAALVAATPPPVAPKAPVTAYEAGQNINKSIAPTLSNFTLGTINDTLEKDRSAIVGFWNGLFGR